MLSNNLGLHAPRSKTPLTTKPQSWPNYINVLCLKFGRDFLNAPEKHLL